LGARFAAAFLLLLLFNFCALFRISDINSSSFKTNKSRRYLLLTHLHL
jgi:hypothetical protein